MICRQLSGPSSRTSVCARSHMRVEQLCPFPAKALIGELSRFPQAGIVSPAAFPQHVARSPQPSPWVLSRKPSVCFPPSPDAFR